MGDYTIKSVSSKKDHKSEVVSEVFDSIRHRNNPLLFFVGETEGLLDHIERSFGYRILGNQAGATVDSDSKYPIIRVDLKMNHYTNTTSFDNQLRRAINGSIFDATRKYGDTWGNRYVTVTFVDLLAGIPHPHSNLEIVCTLAKYMRDFLGGINEKQKRKPILLIDNYDSILNCVGNCDDAKYCMSTIGRFVNALASDQSLMTLTVVTGQHNPNLSNIVNN